MTLKEYLENMSAIDIVFILAIIWLLDVIITFIGINIIGGFMEANKLSRFFFSLGLWGWILDIAVGFIVLYLLALFVKFLQRMDNKFKWLPTLVVILVFYIFEIIVIIHNLRVLL